VGTPCRPTTPFPGSLIHYESKIHWRGKLSTSPRLQRSQIWIGAIKRQARNHYTSINGWAATLQMKITAGRIDKEGIGSEEIMVNDIPCPIVHADDITAVLIAYIVFKKTVSDCYSCARDA